MLNLYKGNPKCFKCIPKISRMVNIQLVKVRYDLWQCMTGMVMEIEMM